MHLSFKKAFFDAKAYTLCIANLLVHLSMSFIHVKQVCQHLYPLASSDVNFGQKIIVTRVIPYNEGRCLSFPPAWSSDFGGFGISEGISLLMSDAALAVS